MRAFKIIAAMAALGALGALALVIMVPATERSGDAFGVHYPNARYDTLEIHPSYHSSAAPAPVLDQPSTSTPGSDATLVAPVEEALPYRYPASQKTYVF
ncbi:hypothetical protein [Larsenimonas salina]|uniref:hypothetical protein n=1 Tax=Larsenimonas salina TaxID=1295565 RepID=UPI002074632C|nr:hypothetical protein [Larsenimonas salina]MCM5705239.1 hypothetical protein [Larsenimonas salina]